MKEAAGEANITVITIVLIAIVLAIGTPLVRSVLDRTAIRAACTSQNGKLAGNGKQCQFTNEITGKETTVTCKKDATTNEWSCAS